MRLQTTIPQRCSKPRLILIRCHSIPDMNIRRPSRPADPDSRRNLFHAPSRRPNLHLNSSKSSSSLHIPAEEADPKDDLVERDSTGDFKLAAPQTNLRPGAALRSEMDDEIGTLLRAVAGISLSTLQMAVIPCTIRSIVPPDALTLV